MWDFRSFILGWTSAVIGMALMLIFLYLGM